MPISVGSHRLGPENGTLLVRTKKGGAAAAAGHNLTIEVAAWSATLEIAEDPAASRIELSADSRSMTVLEGTGGVMSLGDDDKANIKQTIDEEVLKGTAIEFHSTQVQIGPAPDQVRVAGELELAGARAPVAFELSAPDGRLTGSAVVKQTDFGMKPYSALFGTLKVLDEVTIEVTAELPASTA
jgi:polyisoprenoid-binding protein YceI